MLDNYVKVIEMHYLNSDPVFICQPHQLSFAFLLVFLAWDLNSKPSNHLLLHSQNDMHGSFRSI